MLQHIISDQIENKKNRTHANVSVHLFMQPFVKRGQSHLSETVKVDIKFRNF